MRYDDASGIWVGIARAQIRQLKMDLGRDYDCDWDWDCNWDWHWDWHMVLLLTVTKCGHVKVGGGGSGIYNSSSVLDVGTSTCFGWSPEVFGQSI